LVLMTEYNTDMTKPNILMICTDHLRWDWLGCNGNNLVQTPQIDKLAAQGVNFQRAMSECPVCVPARRILMTGRDTRGISMSENRDTQDFPEGPKLAELVTRAGYQTFAAGKLHTWPQRNRIGFEDVQLNEEGRRQGDLTADDYDRWLADNGVAHRAYAHGMGNNQYGARLSPIPTEYTTTAWTGDRAMEFLQRRDPTRPFFLYTSFDKPHPPITPPAEFYELYRDVTFPDPVLGAWVEDSVPSRIRHLRNAFDWDALQARPHEIQQTFRGYAAMITHIDSTIGNVIGQIRELGELDNTWIMFLSDHGDQLFDHGNFAKGDHLAGSCRIPYIITPPAQSELGSASGTVDTRHAVGLADVMPTILDIINVPVPTQIAGQSLVPLLADGESDFRSHSYGHCTVSYAVSDGRYRYVWFADDDRELLFDQDMDPRDEHDLIPLLLDTTREIPREGVTPSYDAPSAQQALSTARAKLAAWLSEGGDPHADSNALWGRRAIYYDWKLSKGNAVNIWNNRGRH
jgi:arylsulfatase A-like enzyme